MERYVHFKVNNSMNNGRQRPTPKIRKKSFTFIKYYLTFLLEILLEYVKLLLCYVDAVGAGRVLAGVGHCILPT